MRVRRSTAVVLLIASLSLHYCYTFYTFDSSFVSFLIMTINCYARYICGTEGTFYKNGGTTTSFHSYFNSTSTLPDPWRAFNPLNHQQDSSSIIYLSTFFLSGCVTFVTFFYGFLLKLLGRQQLHSPRPIPPAHPKFDRYCGRLPRLPLLVALGALNTAATGAHLFNLSSDLHFNSTLQRCRSYKGELQSFKLSESDRLHLQQKLRHSAALFNASTNNNDDVFSAIIDSGSSYSGTNTFSDVIPSSVRRLEQPINLQGIAGGLTIEYVGVAQ